MQAEELLHASKLQEALAALEGEVRKDPASAKLRVFLFQLLSVLGDWERALNQLNVAAELDNTNLLMAQVCRSALVCEAFRQDVFSGKRIPLVFGEPKEWIGLLVQANQMIAEEKFETAKQLRASAFDSAPAVEGTIDGQSFQWICDADSRLGPVLEAIIDGKYYWVPFTAIKRVQIEPPVDLRDMVWAPARFTWVNGGEVVALIPTRYPGSEASEDNGIRLARKTDWLEQPGQTYLGLGQRVLTTDKEDFGLLQVREIVFNHAETEQQTGEATDG